MNIKIITDLLTKNLINEIESITDGAILYIDCIKYDKDNKIIFLPIERYKNKQSNILFSLVKLYRRDKNYKQQSLITIRNIVDCKVENNIKDTNTPYITMLFGMVIRGKEISVVSAEESSGETCYVMNLKVEQIDVEINDTIFETI